MSVEDVEDVYIFGLLITGFLHFRIGGYLAYRVIRKTWEAVQSIPKLPAMDGVCRANNTHTEMLREQNRKLDAILEQNCSLAARSASLGVYGAASAAVKRDESLDKCWALSRPSDAQRLWGSMGQWASLSWP
ncbi:hypothetical protein CRENBAI_006340 [Crenichthys baileyi]|uniref:Uncharacterized protein n=1 Tax=Crenichthys baileyi TaxID=28760 RepID=A0AAV9QN21_9TELE